MPELFLIPHIDVPGIYDAVMRDWLGGLEENAVKEHLEYPFKLKRYFPESARFALQRGDSVHNELLSLFDTIDPQAVFLDISTDLYALENKYNNRLISPHEFWLEYYRITSEDIHEPARSLYRIYINEIIDKNIRFIESKERLPLNVLFYGLNMGSKKEQNMFYEEAFNIVEEFTLKIARDVNEIMNIREKPQHLWHSTKQIMISYEETEKFYDELLYRIKRLLKYKVRDYFVKSLWKQAEAYVESYEIFLDHKMRAIEKKVANIIEGLKLLKFMSNRPKIVVLCDPADYTSILDHLKKEIDLSFPGISIQPVNLDKLFDKMKPFIQKNRIMQSNYEIALNILNFPSSINSE